MDPLTHTLVGASLASTRLGRTTRLATPALVIGANLPDVDVLSYFWGADAALGFRRGWTHGVPAQLLLPALFATALWLWSRRWPAAKRRQVSGRWLGALSYLAVLTHPALDWLNTYGMRWWMPFSDRWSYGDSLFIMDPWLWLALGGCWLLTRRPTAGLAIAMAVVAALLALVVASRAPGYLPLVAVTAVALLAAMLVRLDPGSRLAHLLPGIGLAVGAAYIGGMLALQGVTESRVRAAVSDDLATSSGEVIMVGPMPADPLRWDLLYLDERGRYRFGSLDWRRGGELWLSDERLLAADRAWLEAAGGEQVPGFLRWTRFPWIEAATPAPGEPRHVMDARYARRRTTGFGGALFEAADAPPPATASSPGAAGAADGGGVGEAPPPQPSALLRDRPGPGRSPAP